MGQNIKIEKINERGQTIEELEINFTDLIVELHQQNKLSNFEKKYPWLSTIDSFGDTYFNNLQIPFVVDELKGVKKEMEGAEIKNIIDRVIAFLEGIDTHQYIKFIGD